jgi:hypothetical protein
LGFVTILQLCLRPFLPRFWGQELQKSHCSVPGLGGGPS